MDLLFIVLGKPFRFSIQAFVVMSTIANGLKCLHGTEHSVNKTHVDMCLLKTFLQVEQHCFEFWFRFCQQSLFPATSAQQS